MISKRFFVSGLVISALLYSPAVVHANPATTAAKEALRRARRLYSRYKNAERIADLFREDQDIAEMRSKIRDIRSTVEADNEIRNSAKISIYESLDAAESFLNTAKGIRRNNDVWIVPREDGSEGRLSFLEAWELVIFFLERAESDIAWAQGRMWIPD